MCTHPERAQRAARGRHSRHARHPRGPQRGLTLVELVVSLVIAGVVMSTMWSAWTLLGRSSADPLVSRQQLAVAQSLLREIELQPLPGTATAAATPGRTGYASITDYHGLVLNGITDIEGSALPQLQAYKASITVQAQALAGVPATDGWWITVAVTGPAGNNLVMAQWRGKR